jgi:alpha-tubulin suppressor-like RCC1 family protein
MRKSILGALLLMGCTSGGAGGGLGGAGADNSDEASTGGTTSESSDGGGSGGSGTGGSGSTCVSPEEMTPVGCAEERPDLGSCVLVARDADGDGFPGECEVPDRPGVTFLRHPTDPSKAWDCRDDRSSIHPGAWDGPPIPGRPNRCNDDRDNDCSGIEDDGEAVYEGKTYTCTCSENGPLLPCGETPQGESIVFPGGSPQGECKWGARICDDGRWEECNGAVGPRNETCAQYLAHPDKDYDCDGTPASEELDDPEHGVVDTRVFYCDVDGDGRLAIDEESVLTVRACAPPTTGCGPGDAGSWIESPQSSAFADCDDDDPDVGGLNQAEVCDGKDNDCDGYVDEDILFDNQNATFDCVGGTPVILSCSAGKLSCDNNILGNGCETSIDLNHCYDCETACHFACSAITEECAEVTALALGNEFSCVKMQDGRVSCFGEGSSGQLGDGQSLDSSTPVLVLDLQDPQQIKAGGSHMCAIAEDSRVFCWGEGADGQVGTDAGEDLPKPNTTFAIDFELLTGAPAESLGLGTAHSCAITTNHQLQCWGRGTKGQLGDGGEDSRSVPMDAYKFVDEDYPPFDDAVEVTAGDEHTCARTTAGLVFCAGESADGRLGVSSPSEELFFEQVSDLTDVASVSAGWNHTCAVEEGKVFCWGKNDWGQIGKYGAPSYATPQEVAGISTAVVVASGGAFSCALLQDATISCWGDNTAGQLGPLGPSGSSPSPVVIDGPTDVVEIEAGGGHVCARRSNNQVYCWGANQSGQLGRGSQSTGSATPSPPSPLSNSPL